MLSSHPFGFGQMSDKALVCAYIKMSHFGPKMPSEERRFEKPYQKRQLIPDLLPFFPTDDDLLSSPA
jgi:hypothetical protein